MSTSLINVGSVANDGTGNPIRTAFQTLNDNFNIINGAVFSGTQSTIISAYNVTGGWFVSNSFIVANTYVNAASIVGNTVTSNGNLYVSQQGAYIVGNVTIVGNLSVSGSQQSTASQNSGASILALHYSATPLALNDGRDIGTIWQYYVSGAEKKGFIGWQNSTQSLVYLDDATESAANIITAGTFGNVQFGSLTLSNTTAATSNVTGALKISGGASVGGNLYVAGNVVSTFANVGNLSVKGNVVGSMYFSGADTVYIWTGSGYSPVQTAAQAFNGGTVGLQTIFQPVLPSTSTSTGAVVIQNGGLGVQGNVHIGGNLVMPTSNASVIRGNISGNIFTAAQPFITSLGTLTSLSVAGQVTTYNITPAVGNTYTLGIDNSSRWNKIWTYDMDLSGTLTGATVNTSGGTHSGNLALNGSNPGLTTNQSTVYLFNETATMVKIGAAGTVDLDSNVQSTSTSTGALQISGGVGIGGNVYIRGSAGNAAILQGNVWMTGNLIPGGANVTYNLGSTTQWWNTFYGVSTQAQYADLAERYIADDNYSPGTVVVFGGSKEITITKQFADHRVAGVISTEPAYLMNAATDGLPVALRGRVPVRVVGPVHKGDLLVTSDLPGCAVSVNGDTSHGVKIFAKSLESSDELVEKIIEAVIL